MEKVIWSKRSLSSIRMIWNFYAEKDIGSANKVVEEIISTVENIKNNIEELILNSISVEVADNQIVEILAYKWQSPWHIRKL